MVIQEINPEFIPGAKIKVLWVGGCGNKALNRMITEWLEGVTFVAINTDAQDLATNLADKKVNIGLNLTKGLGAGANPSGSRPRIYNSWFSWNGQFCVLSDFGAVKGEILCAESYKRRKSNLCDL